MNNIFLLGNKRSLLRKAVAGFLMLGLNLTGGLAVVFATANTAYATPENIWDSGFESSTFSDWTSHDNDWQEVGTEKHDGTKSAKVAADTTGTGLVFLTKETSTAGYDNISISFWYLITETLESGNEVKLQVSSDGGTSWTTVTGTVINDDDNVNADSWTQISASITNSADDNANFQLRFAAKLKKANSGDKDIVYLDSFILTGEQIVDTTPATYTLDVSRAGSGEGAVAGSGIICGADCDDTYDSGTVVELEASPSTGSTFTGWSGTGAGSCTTALTCSVTMDAAKTVTATFELEMLALSVTSVNGAGSVSSDIGSISCGNGGSACTENYEYNSTVTLTANPDTISNFSSWGGACSGTSLTCTLSMTEAKNVTATFAAKQCESGTTGTYPNCVSNQVCGNDIVEAPEACDDANTQDGDGCSASCSIEDQGPVDVCSNILDVQTEVPFGMESVDGECVAMCNADFNLLQNGGFEAPVITETDYNQGGWGIVPFAEPLLSWLGEFVTPGGEGRLGLELQAGVAGTPHNGSAQLAELDGDHPTRIYQDVPTIPGDDYTLSYYFSPRPGYDASENILEVALDGNVVDTHTGSITGATVWAQYTKTFTATGAVTRVAFADIGNDDSGSNGGVGSFLDDVSLSCVGPHEEEAYLIIKKETIGGDDEFSFTLNGNEEDERTFTIETDEGEGQTESITLTPDVSYTIDEPATEGWEFTSVSCEYDGESVGSTVDDYPAQHVINVEAGDTVTCTYTNTKIVVEENTPQLCTDRLDNDQDQSIDGNDPDCKPTITVTKHVVNDNGLTKAAGDFNLHVNVDQCTNLDGMQNTVPDGMYQEGSYCGEYERDALNSILDFFLPKVAFAITQLTAPANFIGNEDGTTVYFDGPSDYTVTEDTDAQYTTTYGEGCTGSIGWGEHKTCTVTNDDIAQGGGGGGSSSFDYWGCTNPAATNYNSLANRDDGSCQVPGGTPPTGGETPQGEVLGASTVTEPEMPLPPSCAASPYITDFMKMGKKNDVEQVKLLQTFLNEYLGTNIPVTGFFGPLTKAAVKKLQKDNHAEIIQPWIDAGFSGASLKEGTGVVYKTTKYFINKKKCAELTETLPNLTNDPGLTD